MTTLTTVIRQVHEALDRADLPHAFGGALALAYHVEEPRATRDIDVNVFVDAELAERVIDSLPRKIVASASEIERCRRDGQIRLFYEDIPIDLFLNNHPFHDQVGPNIEFVPFGRNTIPILGATDLAVFKVFFNRTKDWADLEAMAEAHTFDPRVVTGWVVELLGPHDERVERLRAIVARS